MRRLVDLPIGNVLDNFTDSNNIALDAHTPDTQYSGGWTQTASNSFYIQGNNIQPNRYTNGDIATIETGLSDFTLRCTVTPYNSGANRGDPGIIFRYTDSSNYWYAYPESDGPVVVVNKVVNGVTTTVIIMKYFALLSGKATQFRIDCKAQDITLWLDDKEIVTVTDAFNQTATRCGILCKISNAPAGKPSWQSFQVQRFLGTYIDWPIFTELSMSTPLIDLGAGGAFDSVDINNPGIRFDSVNNRWVMAYSGNDGTNVQGLGLAYANSLDAPTWTKEATNPVLLSAPGDTFGMNGALIKFKGTWYYYYGANTGSTINVATSPDLITWTKQGIVLQGTSNGSFDHTGVFDACIRLCEDGNTLELWYCGKNGSNVSGLGVATSTDGINFTRKSRNPVFSVLPFAGGNFGEPDVYVPTGQEGKQILISLQGSKYNVSTTRFIVQALSFDWMKTWHFRINVLVGNGSGWESVQVFDPNIVVNNGTMYMFHSGSNTTGNALNLSAKMGVATTPFPAGKFTAT